MKTIITYINEKLKIKKHTDTTFIKTPQQFADIVMERTSNDGTYIDLSNLDFTEYTENELTEFQSLCDYKSRNKVQTINVTGWVLGNNIHSLSKLFCNLETLTEVIGFETIDLRKIVTMCGTFQNTGFENIKLTNIDFEHVSRMDSLFAHCRKLKSVDLSGWNVPGLRLCYKMFSGCNKLETVEGLNTWQSFEPTEMYEMFMDCTNLTTVDINNINTSNVINTLFMFSGCKSLQSIDISKWNIDKLIYTQSMFYDCIKLETIGDFPTTTNAHLFHYCSCMFMNCIKLKLDLSHITAVNRGHIQNFSKGTNPKIFKRPRFKI